MESVTIGFLGIGFLILLLMLRMPVGIALCLSALGGTSLLRGASPAVDLLGGMPFGFSASWTLSAVPMFLLMGSIAFHSGLTRNLYAAARVWMGSLPGGLAVATNFASAGFAAASGSSLATAAAMGRLAIPEMLSAGYAPSLATSVVAAAGTLGALIPPSVAMVIYGIFAEQPVGKLLIAGLLPGILTAVVYAVMIVARVIRDPSLAPPLGGTASRKQKMTLLFAIWPIPLLILVVVGGIYGGVTTPTEAAAFGALVTCVIAALRGQLSWKVLKESVSDATRTTANIFMIGFAAIMFSRFLVLAGIPTWLTSTITQYSVGPFTLILLTMALYVFLGMFLDPLGLMLLTLPIVVPAFEHAGINMIWAGVLVVKFVEIGFITPPMGMNAFVIKGIVGSEVAITTIFRGLVWFIAAELLITGLLIMFPGISLLLPTLMR
jgi:C4-dicarboxylate transporter DctM subunit